MSDLAKVEVNFLSTVEPDSVSLNRVRRVIQQDLKVNETFIKAKTEAWSVDTLTEAILPLVQQVLSSDVASELQESCRYLVEEFFAIGNKILIINSATGKAIAAVSEEDFYTPAAVPREGSKTLVSRPPTLRPEVQGFLVHYVYENEREAELLKEVSSKLATTPYLREVGDTRLKLVTRFGRTAIITDLQNKPASEIFWCGPTKDFLNSFPICVKSEQKNQFTLSLSSNISIPIQDIKASNLRFNTYEYLRINVAKGWMDAILGKLAEVLPKAPQVTSIDGLIADTDLNWFASVDTCKALRGKGPVNANVYGSSSSVALGFSDAAGSIEVHESTYKWITRELHDTWDVITSVDVTVSFDVSKCILIEVPGVEASGASVV